MINRLLAQLQQRRVTRVAAMYAAAAWALLQVADVMFPIIGLSEKAIAMVLVLAVVGFPLSLILSWVFNITPHGLEQTSDTDIEGDVERFHLTPLRAVAIAAALVLVLLVGYLIAERLYQIIIEPAPPVVVTGPTGPTVPSSSAAGRATIAVLPFENFSDVADMEHFGDGLAEEILNLLAKLDELSVAARTSSFYFKGKDFDIPAIARHLGVRYVLEGSVRRSGRQVRVTAQLIDARNGFHLWSETYDREPDNVFSVQDEISREVVDNLQLIISPESKGILDEGLSVNPRAYEFYLRGRDYLRKPRDPQSLKNAEGMFSKAVSIAPDYPDAFAGLCDTQLQQYFANHEKLRFSAAEKACHRAQELDDSSPAVYVALGNLYRASGQFALAERKFNRALTLKPGSVDAHIGLAETFKSQGKYTLAEQTLGSAIELEPNNWAAAMAMGRYLFDVGRVEESTAYFERIDDLLPESNAAANNLGSAYFLLGRFEDASSAWEKALSVNPMATVYANLGSSYFFQGRYDDAAAMYPKALEMAPESFENWGNLADAYRHSTQLSALAPAAYERAIALANEYLQINPSDAFALAALGHYLACTDQREAAFENIGLARQLAQNDMMVYYFSATALCALGEKQLALDAVRTALSLGYPLHMVEADAGLEGLKQMPDYAAVLAEGVRQYAHLGAKEPEQ